MHSVHCSVSFVCENAEAKKLSRVINKHIKIDIWINNYYCDCSIEMGNALPAHNQSPTKCNVQKKRPLLGIDLVSKFSGSHRSDLINCGYLLVFSLSIGIQFYGQNVCNLNNFNEIFPSVVRAHARCPPAEQIQ